MLLSPCTFTCSKQHAPTMQGHCTQAARLSRPSNPRGRRPSTAPEHLLYLCSIPATMQPLAAPHRPAPHLFVAGPPPQHPLQAAPLGRRGRGRRPQSRHGWSAVCSSVTRGPPPHLQDGGRHTSKVVSERAAQRRLQDPQHGQLCHALHECTHGRREQRCARYCAAAAHDAHLCCRCRLPPARCLTSALGCLPARLPCA